MSSIRNRFNRLTKSNANRLRISLLLFAFMALAGAPAVAAEELAVNGGFDYGHLDGVAFEWNADGDGFVSVSEGAQWIRDIPAGGESIFFQVIPFIAPGSRYRAVCEVAAIEGAGASAWLGLASRLEPSDEEIAWLASSETGVLAVETVAADANLVVYLAILNTEGRESASGAFDNVSVQLVDGVGAPAGVRTAARTAEYAAGMHYLENRVPREAERLFKRVVEDLPDARPDAAMALVRLNEVSHFDMWLADTKPVRQRERMLGVEYLRQALIEYPDQPEACALALCKMGEYYVDRLSQELGRDHLERAIRRYPDSDGARWARLSLLDYHRHKGDMAAAEPQYQAIKAAYESGLADARQMVWAEARYKAHTFEGREKADFLQDVYNRFKESAPEPAVRVKRYRLAALAEIGSVTRQTYKDELEELVADLGYLHPLTDGYRVELAGMYSKYGQTPEYHARAVALCNEVLNAENADWNHIAQAQRQLDKLNSTDPEYPRNVKFGQNVIRWHTLGRSGNWGLSGWDIYGTGRNWDQCDWRDHPDGEIYRVDAAWNSINLGEGQDHIEAVVTQFPFLVAASAPFEASIWVAAEGFMGGDLEDTVFELTLTVYDGFENVLLKETTGRVEYNLPDHQWQRLSVSGVTPPGSLLGVYEVFLRSAGEGHHAVALHGPSLVFGQ